MSVSLLLILREFFVFVFVLLQNLVYRPRAHIVSLNAGGVVGMLSDAMYLQVYTVGPDYAHAEARKSPALDGKVERDSEGKEIRYPVMLTAMEKLVARKVCVAFKVDEVPWMTVL